MTTGVQAQQQEEKLVDRIERRENSNLTFVPQKGSATGVQLYKGTRAAKTDAFYIPQRFRTRDYLTGEYATHSTWFGDFKYATGDANTKGKFAIPNAATRYRTKDADTKTDRESGKTYKTRSFVSRLFLGKENARLNKELPVNAMRDVGWQGNLKEMSIDEVRDLLNKNR